MRKSGNFCSFNNHRHKINEFVNTWPRFLETCRNQSFREPYLTRLDEDDIKGQYNFR